MMRKPIVFQHQWLLFTCYCTFALLSHGVSPRLVDGVGGVVTEESTDRSPETTDPYNNNEAQEIATDSTDLSLNFESATLGDESFETTTTIGTYVPVAKTGRHFGGRVGSKNGSSGGINRNNIIFPALRIRPSTTPVIAAYNYNRVVKRRKNPLVNSTYLKSWNGSVEIASGPPPDSTSAPTTEELPPSSSVRVPWKGTFTTTSQNPLLNRRKTLAELRSSRPTPITIKDNTSTTSLGKTTITTTKTTTTTSKSTTTTTKSATTTTKPTTTTPEPEVEAETGIDPMSDSESTNDSPVEASAVSLSPSPSVSINSIRDFSLNSEPVSRRPVSVSSELFIPQPLESPPSFEYNPSVTSKNGIYHFRYTTTLPTSSRVVHAEEFGITRESYGEDEDHHPSIPEDQQEEPPTTWKTTSLFPPEQTTVIGSEEDISTPTLSPIYRDYFQDGKGRGSGLSVKFEESGVRSISSSSSISTSNSGILNDTSPTSNFNLKNRTTIQPLSSLPPTINIYETNRPTPSLPFFVKNAPATVNVIKVDQTTQTDTDPIVINSTSNNNNNVISHEEPQEHEEEKEDHSHQDPHHHDFNGNVNGIFITSSSRVSVNSSVAAITENKDDVLNMASNNTISPTPTISSREFKSTYFSSAEHPLYTISSYSYSSSKEYSFFVPDEHHHSHHDVGDDHDHENETDEQQHLDDPKKKEQQELRPSTSTLSYWDTLGLKSADASSHLVTKMLNDSSTYDHHPYSSPSPSPNPSPSPSPSPAGDLESSFSTPEAKISIPPPLTTPRPSTIIPFPSSSEENEINSSIEDGVGSTEAGGDGEYMNVNLVAQIPAVPFVIQIWLDMQASMFCNNLPIFKEMIVKVYQEYSNVSSDQVVIFNEPNCDKISNSSITPRPLFTPLIELKNTSIYPTLTSTSRTHTLNTANDVSSSNNKKKNNKTKRAHPHVNGNENNETNINNTNNNNTSLSNLYSIYIYMNDKNGTYDLKLTSSFIDFWNNSSRFDDDKNTFFNKIRKVEMISSSQSITGHAPTNENAGIIAAITTASIAAVCLLVIGILLLVMRHRQAKTKFAKRCTPVTLDDYSLDNISVFNSFRRKQRNRASKRSYTNAGFEDHNVPSKPMNATALLAFNPDISTLADEFSLIPNVNPTLDDIPSGAETKNRFANVIPMPDTRVLLTFQDEQPNSDYINANFTRGMSNTNKAYIITQGPLDETIVDFWRMIWEQQVRVILMLTDFSEAGIPKCAEYYPRSETLDCSQLHGDFQITLEKRDVTENCITSNLVIKDMDRSLRRDVVHLWYHSWPEKGVPVHPKHTTDFLIKSRKYTKEPCPVVVHCSPGTGRSGTLTACDIGMKELESLHIVDVPQIVKKLRQDRAGCIQTKEQYKHIYDVLQYYASKLSSTQLDSV